MKAQIVALIEKYKNEIKAIEKSNINWSSKVEIIGTLVSVIDDLQNVIKKESI